MNKNKLIILLVLLIAVVGLTIGPASAKVIKVNVKNKVTTKKVGKYVVATQKQKYDSKTYLVVVLVAKKNKELKGNKYKSKVYYKYKGKNYSAFEPAEEIEGISEDDLIIFELSGDDEETAELLPIEDEKLLDEVFEEFCKALDEEDGEIAEEK